MAWWRTHATTRRVNAADCWRGRGGWSMNTWAPATSKRGEGDLIDEYVRTRNIRPGEVAYEIDPREHISIRKALRARGRSVLGAYHSHPRTAAVPSAADLAEAHYDGDFVYVIVSLERGSPDVRAYRLERDALIEARFETLAFGSVE